MIIPRANQKNLMLSDDVLAAVEAGQFSVYAVEHVQQALALLSGQEPGQADAHGGYQEGSINGKVVARLKAIAELGAGREGGTEQSGEPAGSNDIPGTGMQ